MRLLGLLLLSCVWPLSAQTIVQKSINSEEEYFEFLGQIWIDRAKKLVEAKEECALHIRYEDFCERPAKVAADLATIDDNLVGIDCETQVKVKDYSSQSISNQNERQIHSLREYQIEVLSKLFKKNMGVLTSLGYSVF